jgi:hypothetical protein
MASVFEVLGIEKSTIDAVKEQKASTSTVLTPAVYDVSIVKSFIRKTDSGAQMLETTYALEDGATFDISVCTGKKDGTVNTGGFADMKHLFDAAGEPDPAAIMGKEKWKDSDIDVIGMPSLTGKRLKIGIRNEQGEYNGSSTLKNLVSAYITTAGKNAKGEVILDDVIANIQRNPVKVSKQKVVTGSVAAATSVDAAAAANAGW